MVFEEFGGFRCFPFVEDAAFGCANDVYRVHDAWHRVFPDAEDGELDGEDALVEATVTVGVGEGIPCGEDVGGRKREIAGRTSPPTTWGGINRKMLPYCESTEAFVWGKAKIIL